MAIAFAPKRGAILLCDFDAARIPSEIEKRRQVVVVSSTALNHRHGTQGPEDILIPCGKYWSFTVDSWVRCKLIATVSHSRLFPLLRQGRPTTSEFLGIDDMRLLEAGLRHVLAIP